MRKVKCDREKPCGACTRIKSATCTFRPSRPGIRSESQRSPGDDTSTSHSNDHDQEPTARSYQQLSGPSNDFGAMINPYVAPGLLGERDGELRLLPVDRPSFSLNSHSDSAQASIISDLLDRIHGLEEKLASATLNERLRSNTSPRQDSSGGTSGQFVKSKFYGQSHWINAINPVSGIYPLLLHSSCHTFKVLTDGYQYDALGDANTTTNHATKKKEV